MADPPPAGPLKRAVFISTVLGLAIVVAVYIAPQWKLGHSQQGVGEYIAQIKKLESELIRTRESLRQCLVTHSKDKDSALQVFKAQAKTRALIDPVVPIDMKRFLGLRAYYGGVSYDTHRCAAPLKTAFPNISNETYTATIEKLKKDMVEAAAKIFGKKADDINPSQAIHMILFPSADPNPDAEQEATSLLVRDPRMRLYRRAISLVLSKYLVYADRTSLIDCKDSNDVHGRGGEVRTVEQLGSTPCPDLADDRVVGQMGYHAVPQLDIDTLATHALEYGMCTKNPDMVSSYGEWLKEDRMFNPAWRTFHVDSEEEDHLLFMLDVMYEKLGIFKKQYWLGVITMQNPFDIMSISDIIYTQRPDLLIETGTANGGSALLWASLFHLYGMDESKVITMDVNSPEWDPNQTHWGGHSRENPVEHPLWKKHVTFVKGDTVSAESQRIVEEAVSKAKKVMVLLDSDHTAGHVLREMNAYCKHVTPGLYCIIEDTKMSRWSSNGPLAAVKKYMETAKDNFEMDRERELLFSHHVMGYLKRKEPKAAANHRRALQGSVGGGRV